METAPRIAHIRGSERADRTGPMTAQAGAGAAFRAGRAPGVTAGPPTAASEARRPAVGGAVPSGDPSVDPSAVGSHAVARVAIGASRTAGAMAAPGGGTSTGATGVDPVAIAIGVDPMTAIGVDPMTATGVGSVVTAIGVDPMTAIGVD